MSIADNFPNDNARLSKLLFDARELIDMYADVVRARTGQFPDYPIRVREQIDEYRAGRGWSLDGFGGER